MEPAYAVRKDENQVAKGCLREKDWAAWFDFSVRWMSMRKAMTDNATLLISTRGCFLCASRKWDVVLTCVRIVRAISSIVDWSESPA